MPAEICMHPWKFAVEPFRIAGNLYYVGNSSVSAHLIDTGEGLILLDTTYPQTVYLLLESIRRLGFDPGDIKYIMHSHGHYDHFGGTRAIVELTGAKTFLGAADIEFLTERPELTWAPEYGVDFHEAFEVNTALAGGETVKLGDAAIECVHTPGHTPGTMSWFFDVREKGKSYRVGAHGGPGLNTLSDEFLEENNLPRSNRQDFLKSLQILKKREVDIFIGLHPGQSNTLERAAAMTETHNPFIDPGAWPAALAEREKDIRELLQSDSGNNSRGPGV